MIMPSAVQFIVRWTSKQGEACAKVCEDIVEAQEHLARLKIFDGIEATMESVVATDRKTLSSGEQD